MHKKINNLRIPEHHPPPGVETYNDDGASDKDGDEYAAVESECDIVDETV